MQFVNNFCRFFTKNREKLFIFYTLYDKITKTKQKASYRVIKMNVFDFDKTIYDGDSTKDFFFYCVGKYPAVAATLPSVALHGIMWGLHIIGKEEFKANLYKFLEKIPDIDAELEEFWDQHIANVKKFYLDMQKEDDVIISASPYFLLLPAINRLGIKHLMASPVNKKTGALEGKNCHGEEKVRRYKEKFPHAQIGEFYSDSYSDTPLAKLAFDAILVKGSQLKPWDEKKLKEEK